MGRAVTGADDPVVLYVSGGNTQARTGSGVSYSKHFFAAGCIVCSWLRSLQLVATFAAGCIVSSWLHSLQLVASFAAGCIVCSWLHSLQLVA